MAEPEAFRLFLRRVWRDDIEPLLRDRRAQQRRTTAAAVGKTAAAGGLMLDTLFGLKGKPFARFMTVVGSSVGAMLPDAWDWKWLREAATDDDRRVIDDQLRRRAGELSDAEALALFELPPTASEEDLKRAWRDAAQRWHPDKAASPAERAEFHVRFIALARANERLRAAFAAGRLPIPQH